MPDWIFIVVAIACLAVAAWLTLRSTDEDAPPSPAPRGTDEDAAAQKAEPEGLDVGIEVDAPDGDPEALHEVEQTGDVHLEVDVGIVDDTDGIEDEPTGPVARILVTATGRTDKGKKRKHNEDAILVWNELLFVIADGMGGYAAGEVASQITVDVMKDAFESKEFPGDRDESIPRRGDELVRTIKAANTAIRQQAEENEEQRGMGSTVVAARFSPNKKRVYVTHVGDSRCYRIRDGDMEQMTVDHTLASIGIPGKHGERLIRALGVEDAVDVDLRVDEPHGGDYYLLCTDGLYKMVPDDVTLKIIAEHDIAEAVEALVDEANDRGGKDNVSVILIRVDDIDAADMVG